LPKQNNNATTIIIITKVIAIPKTTAATTTTYPSINMTMCMVHPGFKYPKLPDTRCSIRGCKLHNEEQFICSETSCGKKLHAKCYLDMIIKTSKEDELPPLPDDKRACTKTCYHAIIKSLSTSDSGRGTWTSDGIDGPNDENTSMKILLDPPRR
jgi:hypothetical protein